MHGARLAAFLKEKIEVVEGDISQPGLGLDAATQARLQRSLDVMANSAGSRFQSGPARRAGLERGFDRASGGLPAECEHAGLMHLSTCYVVGRRDGRVDEELRAELHAIGRPGFDAERNAIAAGNGRNRDARESPEIEAALRRQALGRKGETRNAPRPELDNLIRKNRLRWMRNRLRAPECAARTSRLAEYLHIHQEPRRIAAGDARRGLPIAVVRPSIVETLDPRALPRLKQGIKHPAPLSYLLGTYFRQLPSNERKCLDLIPVDMVCRGMTLIAAALIARRHARLSTGDLGQQSLRHGPVHRTHRAGASQALPGAAGPGALAAHALRNHPRFEGALRKLSDAGAKSRGSGHQPGRLSRCSSSGRRWRARSVIWAASKS